jgi:nitric oxide reductase activation protein
MRPNWTRVLECTIQSDPSGIQFAEEVSLTYSMEMKRIKRLFQTIVTGQRSIQRGVSDGDIVEFDKWMASRIDRKLKRQPSEQLYSRTVLNHRDPAVAFLVDLSSSTNEITSEAKPILDVEKAALLLMAEALHGLGDPFAIYGWSGFGREQVVFYTAKSFDEPWSNQTRAKVGGLKWKLENRDGAAIRHAVAKMSSWKHTQKILIILSDGKPLDSGSSQYYDAYAQADTKQALQAARSAGITPFCVTIDPYGQDYLVDMYGPNRFMTIEDLSVFPEKLARLYANLTTN